MGFLSDLNIDNVLFWETFIPISFYGILRYYKLRKNMIIKKRNAKIVLLISILIILEYFSRIWVFIYFTISSYSSYSLGIPLISIIEGIIYPLFNNALIYSILWRFFVIYYKSNWTKSIINLKKIEESNNNIINKKDFFIKYKSNIGNVHYNGKIFFIFYLISFIISSILFQLRFVCIFYIFLYFCIFVLFCL